MKKYLPYIFAFFPVLNIYETGIISFLSIGQILLFFYCILCHKKTLQLKFPIFVIYSTIITIISLAKPGISLNESIFELFSLLLFFTLYSFVTDEVDYYKFLKGVQLLGFVSLIFFFFQYILRSNGIYIIGIIPGLPLSNGTNINDFYEGRLYTNRISSLFQEPAHYAEFMTMFLAIVLYKFKKNKTKLALAMAISFSIILCKSAGGYVLLLACWASWIYYFVKENPNKKTYMFATFAAICLVSFMFLENGIINSVLTRYRTLSLSPENSEYGYSSYVRLFRGYIPFIEGNIYEIIFGHGIGTLLSFVRLNPQSMFLSVTDYDSNWINSFQFLLFSTGIIGTFIFGSYIRKIYKKTSPFGKTLTLIYILAFISSGILLTASSMLFLYMIQTEQKIYTPIIKKHT